ncbi:hypothetical protein KDA23_04220 [Candidatus Saccharibacteria bacterium]|nr:hypothetical protein [Candidatus Saccharibacteria bacterium]
MVKIVTENQCLLLNTGNHEEGRVMSFFDDAEKIEKYLAKPVKPRRKTTV